jgi:hypothetical protein
MAVYVDSVFIPFRRMLMCHMIADTLDELHEMAEAIGMRRSWFQWQASFPHYDVAKGRRAAAIRRGAVVLGRNEYVATMDRLRGDRAFMAAWKKAVADHAK